MTESVQEGERPLPDPVIRQRRRRSLSLVWLVPLVAALVGLSLLIKSTLDTGPTITITFKTAEGLEAGKTPVKFKDVVIGTVKSIELNPDYSQVETVIELTKNAANIAVEDSRFWVVKPRVGLGGVSGLSTLLSGAYIGVDIGTSTEHKNDFVGLETAPPVTHDLQGHRYVLHSTDLGSLDIGSPVYYRRIQVGSIVAYQLADDGSGIIVQAFVNAPYDRFVTPGSRFWNASGVDLSIDSGGIKLNTESVATVFAGGIAFETPNEAIQDPAPNNAKFDLFENRDAALAPPNGPAMQIRMRFRQSIRGLKVNAPIDFQGISLGTVKSIDMEFDRKRAEFSEEIVAEIFPQRLGRAYQQLIGQDTNHTAATADVFKRMIEHGLRAQMRTGNLLTGQLYIALDFMPNAPAVKVDSVEPLIIPTVPGSFDEMQTQIADIVRKLDEIPFGQIGNHANDTLADADSLLKQLNGKLAPQAEKMLDNAQQTLDTLNRTLSEGSPLQTDAHQTLDQLQRAAGSMRALMDYLQRHPEALILGKTGSASPQSAVDSNRPSSAAPTSSKPGASP